MLNEKWYVFKGDHHLGPYSWDQLIVMYDKGQLKEFEMVLKEGNPKWEPLKNFLDQRIEPIIELDVVDEFPPPLPPLPEVEPEPEPEPEILFESSEDEDDIESLLNNRPEEETPTDSEIAEEEDEEQFEFQTISRPASSSTEISLDIPLPSETKQEEEFEPEYEDEIEEIDEDEYLEVNQDRDSDQTSPTHDFEIDDKEFFYDEEEEAQPMSRIKKIFISASLLIIISFTLYMYNSLRVKPVHFSGLSLTAQESLSGVREQSLSEKVHFRMSPTLKMDGVWIASNLRGSYRVVGRFLSKPGRVLGKGKIEFEAESIMVNGAAFFKKFDIKKGVMIHPGEYDVEIDFYPIGMNFRLAKLLKNISITKSIAFVDRSLSKHVLKTVFAFYAKTRNELEGELKHFNLKIEKEILRPLNEERERYSTYLSLLKQLEDLWKDYIGRITKGRSMKYFEAKYNKNIGPMIRDLVVDSNRLHVSFFNINSERSQVYQELMDYGKEIGFLASEMVVRTRKNTKITDTVRKKLKNEFDNEIFLVRDKGLKKVNSIKAKIEVYSK